MTDRTAEAVAKRNKILAYLAENPHSSSATIAEHHNWLHDTTTSLLADMVKAGEAQRHGGGRGTTYTACRMTTRPLEEIRAEIEAKRSAAVKRRAPKPVPAQPEKQADPREQRAGKPYRNDPSKLKPHANQGGGQVAQAGGLQSSAAGSFKVAI